MDTDSVTIGSREFPVWPPGQEVRPLGHRTIGVTTFADSPQFHAALMSRIFAIENDPRFAARYLRSAGGARAHHLELWESPEADLLNARALHMSQMLLGSQTAVIDRCWVTVSRRGDYMLAHSNERTAVTVVYSVDPGEEDPMDPLAGKLAIVDPRVEVCCQQRKDGVTNPLMPKMPPGTMLAFPSAFVHSVNPYTGQRPRVAVTWTIDKDVIPGAVHSKGTSGGYVVPQV